MSGTSKLRWALYEGVYQPALYIPPDEVGEAEVPPGFSAVYLLGLDSTVLLDNGAVEPYDETNTSRTSHPEAALGVETAMRILEGFASSGADGAAALLEDDMDEEGDASVAAVNGTAAAQRWQGGSGDDDRAAADDAEMDSEEEEQERRRRRKEKKLKKKEELRAAKREREVATSAALEEKYNGRRGAAQEGDWDALEDDLFSDDDRDGATNGTGALPLKSTGSRHKRRDMMGQALAALNSNYAMSASPAVPGLASSCANAQVYIMEIRYQYQRLVEEATAEAMVLSKQEYEVIRAIDEELRKRQSHVVQLQSMLSRCEAESRGGGPDTLKAAKEVRSKVHEAVKQLTAPLDVEASVRRIAVKHPSRSTAAFDRSAMARARRHVQRRTNTFQDASVLTQLEQLRSADATQRDDAAEALRRYVQQRHYHSERKMNFRGIGKTGFYAAPKPLERWSRARDMMILANAGGEAQRVKPPSYISQAYSTMTQRMREHAEKKYERVALSAGAGSSFLNPNSFTASSAASPDAVASSLSGHQQIQRFTAAQRRGAFFQFHTLRCDINVPLETVAVHPAMASTMSMNGMASVDASRLLNAADDGAELSVVTDDMGSVSSHSAVPSSYPFLFADDTHSRRHGDASRDVSASARSSRAASVTSAYSEGESEGHVDRARRRSSRRQRSQSRESTAVGGETASRANPRDWRSSAKRCILEQLTLYRRGLRGRPAVLDDEQLRIMAKTLLQRAVQAEAERQNISLSVQASNVSATFTKAMEQRLKRSVDHYVERQTLKVAAVQTTDGERPVPTGVPPTEGVVVGTAAASTTATSRLRAVEDTPEYEA